jgi:hypothetical protein
MYDVPARVYAKDHNANQNTFLLLSFSLSKPKFIIESPEIPKIIHGHSSGK